MEGIGGAIHLSFGGIYKMIKRRQLFVKLDDGLLDHLAMAGMSSGRKLLDEPLAGEHETFALAIALL